MQLDLGSIVDSFNFLNRDSLDSVRLTQGVFNDVVELHMGAVCFRSVEYAKISLANDSSTEAVIRRDDTDVFKRRQGGDIKELFTWFEYWLRFALVRDLRFCQEAPDVNIFSLLSGSCFQATSVQFYDVDLAESAKCPFEEILNDNFNGLNTLMFHSKNVSSPFFTDYTLSTISNKGILKVSVTGVKPTNTRFYDLDEDQLLDALMKCLRYRADPFHIELSQVRVSTRFVAKFMKKLRDAQPFGPLTLCLEPVEMDDSDLMQYRDFLAKSDNLRAAYKFKIGKRVASFIYEKHCKRMRLLYHV
ncbi:hypothetical protein AAVH_09280 [Aphelenchoides avenae]|nr:hypothetical protein AAVH_09280 [Aphelenchus avenae]